MHMLPWRGMAKWPTPRMDPLMWIYIYIYMYIHHSAFLMDGLRPSNPVARSSIHSLQVLHSIPEMLLSITVSWIVQPTRKVRDILVCKFPCLQGSRAALKLSSMLHANSNVTANLDQYKNSNLNYKTMKQNSDNVPFQRHEKYIENHFELMGISKYKHRWHLCCVVSTVNGPERLKPTICPALPIIIEDLHKPRDTKSKGQPKREKALVDHNTHVSYEPPW